MGYPFDLDLLLQRLVKLCPSGDALHEVDSSGIFSESLHEGGVGGGVHWCGGKVVGQFDFDMLFCGTFRLLSCRCNIVGNKNGNGFVRPGVCTVPTEKRNRWGISPWSEEVDLWYIANDIVGNLLVYQGIEVAAVLDSEHRGPFRFRPSQHLLVVYDNAQFLIIEDISRVKIKV